MREIDTIDNLDGTLTIKYLDDSLKRICVFYIYIYIYIYIKEREGWGLTGSAFGGPRPRSSF
jgi:hypothetical protein